MRINAVRIISTRTAFPCVGTSDLSSARLTRCRLRRCRAGSVRGHRVVIRTHTSLSTGLRAAAASAAAGAEMRRRAVSETARRTTLPCIGTSRTGACLTRHRHSRGRSALRVCRNNASRAHTSDATSLGAAAAHAHRTSRRETSRRVTAGARGRGGHVRIGRASSSTLPGVSGSCAARTGLGASRLGRGAERVCDCCVIITCIYARHSTGLRAGCTRTAIKKDYV